MQKEHNCYTCQYKGSVIGSAHSSCNFKITDPSYPFLALMVLKQNEGKIVDHEGRIILEVHSHGLKKGWGDWPINFDPVWINICKIYKPK